jgi:RNA polymerase sigma-70 factor (ECF subfamily)
MIRPARSNEEWVDALRSSGPSRDGALSDLRAILLRGLRHALAGWARTSGREFEALADDFVQEALLKVLGSLDSFKGLSRFTTWALKIAVRVALTELRRKRWQDVSLDQLMEQGAAGMLMERSSTGPESRSERSASLEALTRIVSQELTEKQRMAVAAVALGGMPLEEAARRMGTNRNALYKMIHDARLKLKRRLARDGMTVQDLAGGAGGA